MRLFDIKDTSYNFELIFESKKEEWIVANVKGLDKAMQADPKAHGMNPTQLVDELAKADPAKGKFIVFIAQKYAEGQFKLEDIRRLHDDLAYYMQVQRKLPEPQRNIANFKHLKDLYAAIKPFQDAHEHVEQEIKSGAKTLIDDTDFKVQIPETQEVSCKLGAGTKWCTAHSPKKEEDGYENQFHNYNDQGPLFIIRAGKRKFQLHYESGSFMDEDDSIPSKEDIAYLSQFPGYKKFLDILAKHHYYDDHHPMIKSHKAYSEAA